MKYTKGEQTKNTIIASAIKLFSEKGYENTSVALLVKTSGIAKGSYYYHFKHKEDVLFYIINKDFNQYFYQPEKIAHDATLNPIDKLERILYTLFSRFDSYSNIETYFEEGLPLQFKAPIDEIRANRLVPLMEKTLLEGVKDGYFNLRNTKTINSIIVRGILGHIDAITTNGENKNEFMNALDSIIELLNTLLDINLKSPIIQKGD